MPSTLLFLETSLENLSVITFSNFELAAGFGIHHVLNPDRYRGPFGYDDANAASKYAWDVKNMIEHGTSGKVAGFIAETIQVII